MCHCCFDFDFDVDFDSVTDGLAIIAVVVEVVAQTELVVFNLVETETELSLSHHECPMSVLLLDRIGSASSSGLRTNDKSVRYTRRQFFQTFKKMIYLYSNL